MFVCLFIYLFVWGREGGRGRGRGRVWIVESGLICGGCIRFFWLALYAQPGLWVGLAIFALVRLESPIWLSLNGRSTAMSVDERLLTRSWGLAAIALVLTITNTLAFSRCDKFSQASNLASSAMYSGGMARSLAGGFFSRLFGR